MHYKGAREEVGDYLGEYRENSQDRKGINPHYSQKLDPVGRFHTSLTKTT